ncbi:PorT family protein [Fibrella sp. HMF5335]|uniref:PorT family protein n=1 Tax=Fibrella rubiginis TaxID=2817060 RepID=A0A939K5S5_9BACT|nr:porin family protein [Fibrella rubiginis]MBO0938078.1 PorT family protein [Fibrella rubiginis]
MKRVYLSIIVCLLATAAQAQILFGVQSSFQSSNVSISSGAIGGIDPSSFLTSSWGYRIGAMADIPVTDRLSVRPQLLYSTKGYKVDFSSLLGGFGGGLGGGLLGEVAAIRLTTNYLELPVQAMYGFDAGSGRVVVGAGPYVAYALSGSVDGVSTPFEAGTPRLDAGAALSLGYETSAGMSISAFYSHGFANTISSNPNTNAPADPNNPGFTPTGTVMNRSFGLTLGYFFGTGN